MSNLKLNDTAVVIITKAYLNANIVPSQDKCGIASSRSYLSAVRSFIKNGWVKEIGGLKGTAQEGDYATEEGRRLFFTQAFLDEFYGTEDSIPAIVPNEATNVAAKPAKAKKAPKKVEDIQSEEDDQAFIDAMLSEEEDEDEEDNRNSKVAQSYKKAYAELKNAGGSGQGCNDVVDKWMHATFLHRVQISRLVTTKKGGSRQVNRNVTRLNREAIVAFANENNIFAPKYLTLNNGMLRMDIANKVRAILAKGTPIKYNGKVVLRVKVENKEAA